MTARPHYPAARAYPRVVNIETVSSCNAACIFCPHPLTGKNQNVLRMDNALFDKIVMDVAEHHQDVEEICFGLMNEPTLDPQVFARIRRVRELTPVGVTLITNGSTLTSKRTDEMLRCPPDILKISVTGHDQASYERNMPGMSYPRLMRHLTYLSEQIELLRAAGRPVPLVGVSSVYTDDVAQIDYRVTAQRWAEFGFGYNYINAENRGGFLADRMEQLSSQQWRLRTKCNRPNKQLNVLADGRVVLCCADWREEVVIGNLQHHTISELWHADLLNRYRWELAGGHTDDLDPCRTCMQADVVVDQQPMTNFNL